MKLFLSLLLPLLAVILASAAITPRCTRSSRHMPEENEIMNSLNSNNDSKGQVLDLSNQDYQVMKDTGKITRTPNLRNDSDKSDDTDDTSFEEDEDEEEEESILCGQDLGVFDDLEKHILIPKLLKEGPPELELFGYLHVYAEGNPPKYLQCCGIELMIPDGSEALLITFSGTGECKTDIQVNHYTGTELPSLQNVPKFFPPIKQLPIFIQVSNKKPKVLKTIARWGPKPKQPYDSPFGKKFRMKVIKASLESSLKQLPRPEWPTIQVAIYHDRSTIVIKVKPLKDELINSQEQERAFPHLDSNFYVIPVPNLSEDVVAIHLENGSILFPSDLWTKSKSILSAAPVFFLVVPHINKDGQSKVILKADEGRPLMKLMGSSPKLSTSPIPGSHFKIFIKYVESEIID